MRSFGLTATPSTYGPPLTRVYYLWTGARRTGGENLARLTQVYTKRVDRDRVSLRAASPLPIPTVKVLPPPVLRQPRAARPGFRYSFVWAAVFLLLLEQRLLRRPSWGILVALRERGRYPYMGPWAHRPNWSVRTVTPTRKINSAGKMKRWERALSANQG